MQNPPYKTPNSKSYDNQINNYINVIVQTHRIKRSQEKIQKSPQKIIHRTTSDQFYVKEKAGQRLPIFCNTKIRTADAHPELQQRRNVLHYTL